MAFDALDEHEQSEVVRKWITDNGLSIVVGVILGLLLIFGWQQWRNHRARHSAEAALQYTALTKAIDAKNTAAATATFEGIKKDFPDTSYAVLAAMRESAAALARNEKPAALTAAEWAYAHADGDAMKTLAGLQLARLKLGEGQGEAALDLAKKLPTAGYTALIAELRGDALLAGGKSDDARRAYQEALQAADPASPNRATLEMKLNDLGGSAATIEVQKS